MVWWLDCCAGIRGVDDDEKWPLQGLYMKLGITAFSLGMFYSIHAVAQTQWISMQDYERGELDFCPEAVSWIMEKNESVQELIDADLANYGGQAGFYLLDINEDNNPDVFVVYSGPSMCGSGGCSSKFFVGATEGCKKVSAPTWTPSNDIGVENNLLYLGIPGEVCGKWSFDGGNRLNHLGNIEACPN